MRHLTEEQLVLFHYGDADLSMEVSSHLAACAHCQRRYQALTHALGSMTITPVPERGPEYGREVWQRLAPRLVEGRPALGARLVSAFRDHRLSIEAGRTGLSRLLVIRGWAVGAGVALLAGVTFLVDRTWRQADPVTRAPAASVAEHVSSEENQTVRFKQLGDHLELSRLALNELINGQPADSVDISSQQSLARELASANRVLCGTAAPLEDAELMSALEELERTLLEISTSPPRLSSEQFGELRRRLGPDALLFRIAVAGAQARALEKEAMRELGRNGS
jgi:hypothetical protein